MAKPPPRTQVLRTPLDLPEQRAHRLRQGPVVAVLEVPERLPEPQNLHGPARADDEGERVELTLARPAAEDARLERVRPRPLAAARPVQCDGVRLDRKSTRLNSSHANISYAVFCLKKK